MLNIANLPQDCEEKIILKIFQNTFSTLEKSELKVNLYFINEEEIKNLNKQFRNKDSITDVLSFNYIKDVQMGKEYIEGEIFICMEKIKQQAKEKGHGRNYETYFLFLHGLLHVLGYDHETDEEENEMNKVHKEILNKSIK